MNNKILTGLITGGAIIATAASAYAFSPQNIDSIKTALDNNDYSAWQTAIVDSPNADELTSTINESNFSQLVEAHQLMQDGDREGAKAIMEELGINGMFGGRGGHGEGGMGNNPEQNQAVKDALTNNDYTAWKTAITATPRGEEMLSVINESNFSRLVEAHNLMEQGRAIMDELGLPDRGKGMNKGNQNSNSNNS
jgi:hypothetical protein